MKKRSVQIITLMMSIMLLISACGQTAVKEEAVSAEPQSIGLTSVGNARELGGYKTADGKTVKHGALIRTAALSDASDEDIQKLKNDYNLYEVIDLRMDREVEAKPDPEIADVKNLQLRIMDEQATAEKMSKLSKEDLESLDMTDKMSQLTLAVKAGVVGDQMYIDFLSGDQGKESYRQMFEELLAVPEGKSLLFHCTQGKDRTGCAAMLILSALGVDEDTIIKDYTLTNTFNSKLIEGERQMLIEKGYEGEQLETMMRAMDEVDPQYMRNALDWMKETYGSVIGYINQELGITDEQIETLKGLYLE